METGVSSLEAGWSDRTRAASGGDSGAANTAAPNYLRVLPGVLIRSTCACFPTRKQVHRHEPVELRKGPPPPHRRLERAKA